VTSRRIAIIFALGTLAGPGCATMRQLTALRRVDFSIEQVSGVRLAGIDIARVGSLQALGVVDAARLTAAIAARNVPLDLTIHVRADNPAENPTARLLRMQWALFLDDRQTVAGVLDRAVELPSGQATVVPVVARLNLVEFLGGGATDLVTLARAAAGVEGARMRLSLRATPTIDTPLGAITYPEPITIVRRYVGTRD